MSTKISNELLKNIVDFSSKDISFSISDCADSLNIKAATLSTWHRNFKTGKWPSDYSRTEDGKPLDSVLVEEFKRSFSFSGSASRILKKLVTPKCLRNRSCFAKQHKILKRLFKKYPSVAFWLHVDFGEPREDILLFIGNAEFQLKKKYMDFSAVDTYTPFEYQYTRPPAGPTPKKSPKTIWDFYE
tara:strand:- start:149 stop:706 length:558 start_codon:yes stop_codon:yes gene_type:complete